ncbi:hypothetical protein Sjap_020519 [Stephania japonica]|uniref:Replication protein A 70 kDa DNA-binding subunit B/D first OB fold domain-containing protein n=1 Tax=Stephania japonica TaxID=461633 RepID=A0AAP0F3I7_9MAGN
MGSSSKQDGCVSNEMLIDGLQKERIIERNIGIEDYIRLDKVLLYTLEKANRFINLLIDPASCYSDRVPGAKVMYLGAASGTSISHVSDIVVPMPREKKLLKDIDPNSVNWYADVYVLEKLPVKQGSTSSVQQQRLILVDEEGYQIQATIFGNDINLFESRLQTKVAYRISNAFVKKIEPRYRIVLSPHQWSISRSTLIRQLLDSETFPLLEEAKFVTLEEIDDYLDTNESIDVAVLALIAKPRRHVAKRNGQPACLQELIVVDEWARVEVELTDESGALKVMAYGSIAEDIISLSGKEIMTKTRAIEASKLMATSKLLKSASSFYVYVQADKIVDKTVNRFFLVGISPIKEEVHEQDLNGGGGNSDGLPSANAQTSHLPQPMPCNTKKMDLLCATTQSKETNGEVIVETGEVILHNVPSATASSKREISNPTSRSTKLLKPGVAALESTSTSSASILLGHKRRESIAKLAGGYHGELPVDVLKMVVMVSWNLWNNQNLVVWRQWGETPPQVVRRAESCLREWQHARVGHGSMRNPRIGSIYPTS